jgi:endonuclease G
MAGEAASKPLAYHQGKSHPADSSTVPDDSTKQLLEIDGHKGIMLDKKYFIINYDTAYKIPYWVAYYITEKDLEGPAKRKNNYRIDAFLPLNAQSKPEDYRKSGYDRGHNAPADDFKRNKEAMTATFLMSNMSPQTSALNSGIWRVLEERVQNLVENYGKAWIITGNIFMRADSQPEKPSEFIGKDRVAVPTHCFKAILTQREDGTYDMYSFLIMNQPEKIPGPPDKYKLTVDRLEQITGFDFFLRLDDSLENSLERKIPDDLPVK